jgi:hypothetical protein
MLTHFHSLTIILTTLTSSSFTVLPYLTNQYQSTTRAFLRTTTTLRIPSLLPLGDGRVRALLRELVDPPSAAVSSRPVPSPTVWRDGGTERNPGDYVRVAVHYYGGVRVDVRVRFGVAVAVGGVLGDSRSSS